MFIIVYIYYIKPTIKWISDSGVINSNNIKNIEDDVKFVRMVQNPAPKSFQEVRIKEEPKSGSDTEDSGSDSFDSTDDR